MKTEAVIKFEALTVVDEEALMVRGWSNPSRGRGGDDRGSWRKGRGGESRQGRQSGGGANKTPIQKENPQDDKGEIIKCPSFDSI